MFDYVCLAVMISVAGYVGWKGGGPERQRAMESATTTVAVALVGTIAAVLVAGVRDDVFRVVLIVATIVSLAGGLCSVYGGLRLLGGQSPAVATGPEHPQGADAAPKPLDRPRPAAAFATGDDTSPMEIRLSGSLKSIRDQAEQGLVASDAEKARHLETIWSMAACDLDDDDGQLSH